MQFLIFYLYHRKKKATILTSIEIKRMGSDCTSISPSPFVLPEHAVLDPHVTARELARQIGASQQCRLDHGNAAIGVDVVHFV